MLCLFGGHAAQERKGSNIWGRARFFAWQQKYSQCI